MGFFGNVFKAVARGVKSVGGKAFRGLKSAGESAVRGVKSAVNQIKKGVQKLKDTFSKSKPSTEPKLSQNLRNRGAFKPKPPRTGIGQPKVPFEPPIKVGKFRPVVNKGRALNDPVMTRQLSGYMGESI